MPILTRPVREQLEHDRVIRLLQIRYKRKNEVIGNPGSEQNQSVLVGALAVFPDLLIYAEGGKKLLATVEVETGESVNQLEALAEWNLFAKLRVPLHLYVPPTSVDAARRLCAEHQIPVAEVWTFHTNFDQVRFSLIHRAVEAALPKARPTAATKSARPKAKPASKATAKPAPKARKAAARKPAAKKATKKPAAKKAAKPTKKGAAKNRR